MTFVCQGSNDYLTSLRLEGFRDVVCFYSPKLSRNIGALETLTSKMINWAEFKARPSPTVSSNVSSISADHRKAESCYESTIDCEKLSIASHFKNLMSWSNDESTTLVLGEKGSGNIEDHCVLKVHVDSKNKRQWISVSGPGHERRACRLEHLVGTLKAHRRTFRLIGWKVQHRESIVSSELLETEQKRYQTSALFHTPDGRVIVECVAINAKSIKDFYNFLSSLVPREDEWSIPVSAGRSLRNRQWTDFLRNYCLSAKIKSSDDSSIIHVWGFGNYVDEAKQSLANEEHGGITFAEAVKNPLLINSSSEESYVIVFKEKEMGFYYLAFEPEIDQYLRDRFHVDAHKVEVDFSAASKRNFPPVKMELNGTPENVKAAEEYVNRIERNKIQRIYFPKVDANKYKV